MQVHIDAADFPSHLRIRVCDLSCVIILSDLDRFSWFFYFSSVRSQEQHTRKEGCYQTFAEQVSNKAEHYVNERKRFASISYGWGIRVGCPCQEKNPKLHCSRNWVHRVVAVDNCVKHESIFFLALSSLPKIHSLQLYRHVTYELECALVESSKAESERMGRHTNNRSLKSN